MRSQTENFAIRYNYVYYESALNFLTVMVCHKHTSTANREHMADIEHATQVSAVYTEKRATDMYLRLQGERL